MPTADLNADLDCITRLLDHLWLQERLSQNTLDAYSRDLTKIATRLANEHSSLKTADPVFRLLFYAPKSCAAGATADFAGGRRQRR